jgi:hypothetical protein
VFLENDLYNGEYFIQKIMVEGLQAADPVAASKVGINMNYSPEAIRTAAKGRPKIPVRQRLPYPMAFWVHGLEKCADCRIL